MSQKLPEKQFLVHSSDDYQNRYPLTNSSITNHVGTNTEQIHLNRDDGISTPDHDAEQIDYGNAPTEMTQLIAQIEGSESYWKSITDRRRQATEQTSTENQQLHTLIDNLSYENDKLRLVANHRNYLQHVLETLTAENDNFLHETNSVSSPIN